MPARVLDERYELLDCLGAGAFATVYRALDRRLRRDVAVKILDVRETDDAIIFHREARAIAALKHPNIIQILDYSGPESRIQYIVMELVDGASCADLQKRLQPLSEVVIMAIAEALASALSHAHAHDVIHRDVKPANVLIENGTGRVLLADFGIAKTHSDPNGLGVTVARSHTLLSGTPAYMSPEQIAADPVGPPTDVFALAALIYALAAGRSPFARKQPLAVLQAISDLDYVDVRQHRPDLSEDFVALVETCLTDASERPTMASLADVLESFLAERGVFKSQTAIAELLKQHEPLQPGSTTIRQAHTLPSSDDEIRVDHEAATVVSALPTTSVSSLPQVDRRARAHPRGRPWVMALCALSIAASVFVSIAIVISRG